MSLEFTDEAVEVLRRSLQLGGVDRARGGGIRVRGAHGLGGGFDVQIELAEGPLEGESIVETKDLRLFIDPRVAEAYPQAVVAVEPQHQTLVVRPAEGPDL